MKLLLLLRHASARSGANVPDHDRPLSDEGRAQAAAVASVVARDDLRPDRVLCSTARRAEETLEALADVMPPGGDAEVAVTDRLYLATADDLLEAVRDVADSVARLLVVGHNPGIQRLALALDTVGDDRLQRFPPATLAVLRVDVASWADVGNQTGSLLVFAPG